MKLYNIQVGPIGTNCYILNNEENNEGIIVDPGADASRILHAVEELKLKVAGIFVTHGHSDHIGALHQVRQATKAPVYMSAEDAPMLADPEGNLSRWMGEDVSTFAPEKLVADGDVINVAGFEFKVLATPGHTPGGVCFLNEANTICFVGDTIFCESIGRTDFPGGSYKQILESIKNKIMTLDDGIRLLPGHMTSTSVGWERKRNPYLQ